MPAAPTTGLPPDLPSGTRIDLRPLGLTADAAVEDRSSAGGVLRLAGGPLLFTACEVVLSGADGVARHVVSLHEIEAWTGRLPPSLRTAITSRLEHLTRPRRAPGGTRLERPLLMGVINATPDSFSDGGAHLDPEAAVAHGRRLAAEGADILDIGGESVRPGAEPVAPSLEAARILPVLEGLAGLDDVVLSVDTRHAEVMSAALGAGARLINDVTALTGDPKSLSVAAESAASIALMHMRGEPRTMNLEPAYGDAALEVFDFLEGRVEACLAAGIPLERIIVDPGIGFGKKGEHNLAILRALSLYQGLGCPVLIGVSRKGLTGALDRARPPRDRLAGSLAAAIHALGQGAQILRIHDVAETRQALDVWERLAGLTD